MAKTSSSKKPIAISVIVGFVIAFIALGLPMIGITVNLWLGGLVLAVAFILMAYGFIRWEKTAHWSEWLRTSTVWITAVVYVSLIGYQIYQQYEKEHPHQAQSSSAALPVPQATPASVPIEQELPRPKTSKPAISATPPCNEASRTISRGVTADDSHLPPDVHSAGIKIRDNPCLTATDVKNIGTTVGIDLEGAKTPVPTYQQSCVGSACAQGPNSQATFNQFGPVQRHLTEVQKDALSRVSSTPSSDYFGIVDVSGDSEDVEYAEEIKSVLTANHWSDRSLDEVYAGPVPTGIYLVIPPGENVEDLPTQAKALCEEMNHVGIPCSRVVHHDPGIPKGKFAIYVGPAEKK